MIIKKYKTIFIHIPKNAGTAIETYFEKEWESLHIQGNKHDNIYHIKKKFPELYNSYSKFTIVRNPYDRMVSYYHYLKQNALTAFDDNPWWSHIVEANQLLDKTQDWSVVTFEEWVKDPLKLWHADDMPYFLDPQCDWVDETVAILKFENLKEDVNAFFNKEIDLKTVNTSKHDHYLNYYNEESLDIIYNRYKEDFEKYNYKKL